MSEATEITIAAPPLAPNGSELRAYRSLVRAQASLSRQLDAELERTHGLALSSFEALQLLDEQPDGRMRMRDLAEELQISRSGLTRLVDRLAREAMLERCTCKHDARGAYACLTPLGRERTEQARRTHRALVRENLLTQFAGGELAALAEMCDRIAASG
jgi:DNA-binding MarR family transcriptional regulator